MADEHKFSIIDEANEKVYILDKTSGSELVVIDYSTLSPTIGRFKLLESSEVGDISQSIADLQALAGSSDLNTTDKTFSGGINELLTMVVGSSLQGHATAGGTNYVTDSDKDFEIDALIGSLIKIEHDGLEYVRIVLSNTADTIAFADLVEPTNATVTLGSGVEAEGQIELTCIGDLAGVAGNDISVLCVEGSEQDGAIFAAFADGVLTFTVNKTVLGESQTLAAGSLALYLETANLDDKFSAAESFAPGYLPLGGSAYAFTSGSDGIAVTIGDKYVIL